MPTLDTALRLERPLIGVDLETTGTNPQTARIVQLALEIMRPGQPTKIYKTFVNPEERIPAGAMAVHHITDEMVADAPTFRTLAPNLLRGLVECDFAGTNVRFDLKILAAEFKRAKVAWSYEGARVIDSYRLWQIVDPRSLEDALKRWPAAVIEEADGDAHDALWDIRHSTRIIAEQLGEFAWLPRDLAALHELCSPGWFDCEGKLQWRDGELCFSFGEHRDKSIRTVPAGYLKWIIGKDFSQKVKDVCAAAMKGIYPAPPAQPAPVEDES